MKIGINIIKKKEKDTNNSAKIIIIDSENRVLFLKRSKSVEKFKNNWDLPGGHIQQNESPKKGATRELMEETNLDIPDISFFSEQQKKKGIFYFFYARYNSMPIKLSDEHVDYRFLEKSQLSRKDKFQKVALNVLEVFENE